jgi:hypothetical protein
MAGELIRQRMARVETTSDGKEKINLGVGHRSRKFMDNCC